MFGLLVALAVLLALAGGAKIVSPDATARALRRARLPDVGRPGVRAVGVAEVVVAALALVAGGWLPVALLAAAYAVLAAVSARMVASGAGAACGCFGAAGGSLTRWHISLNVLAALTAAVAAALDPSPLATSLRADGGFLLAAFGVLLAGLLYLAYTALPDLNRARTTLEARV